MIPFFLQVPSPEFVTVHASRLRFSVLPRATSLKMKLQCRSVGSLNEASERSPVFFNQFDHGIYWKYHAIYTSIIYLCDTMDGCQILHQLRDVVKSPWVSTIQGGAGFRNAARIHCSSFLLGQNSGFSTWTRLLLCDSHCCIDMQWFLRLLPL